MLSSLFDFATSEAGIISSEMSWLITLIAASNYSVNQATAAVTPVGCQLSTQDKIINGLPVSYVTSCDIVLDVNAFIGLVSFGSYTQFTFTIRNECFSID